MRKTLVGLTPGQSYAVQARSVLDTKTSEWSQVFNFVVAQDLLAPSPVTSLVGTSNNGAFKFTWVAPTTNTDGTPLKDLKGYVVVVTSPLGTTSRTIHTVETEFTLTAEDVTSIFFEYLNIITLTVYAEDNSNNLSTGVAVTTQKSRPMPPTSLSWTTQGTSFVGTWTPPTLDTAGKTLTNLKDYEVKITSGAVSRFFYTTPANFEFSLEMNRKTFVESGLFTTPRGLLTIDVKARDSFNDLSDAVSATVQNSPPAVPTGLAGTAAQDQISLKWNAVADTDVIGYEIWVNSTNNLGTATRVWAGNATSYVHSTVAYASDHYFWVTAVDGFGQTNFSTAVGPYRPTSGFGVDAIPPGAVTGVTVASLVSSTGPGFTLTWTRNTESDIDEYTIRYSTSSSGPWNYITVPQATSGTTMTYTQMLPAPGSYYVGINVADMYGNSPAGGFVSATPYPVTVAGNTTAPAAPTGVTSFDGFNSLTMQWTENTEADVKWGAGQYEVQVDGYASAGTTPTWSGTNFKSMLTGAPGATISGLAPNLVYNIRVRAINSSNTLGAWSTVSQNNIGSPVDDVPAFSIPADKFATNLLVTSNITLNNDVPNGRLGAIQSSDYNAGTGVGFKLSSTALDIQSGSIAARALTIQNGGNILPPQYAGLEFPSTFYTTNISGTAVYTIVNDPRFETQSFQVTTATTSKSLFFAPTTTTKTFDIEAGKNYIVSFYAKAATGIVTLTPYLREFNAAGTNLGDFMGTPTPQTIPADSTWRRYSMVVGALTGAAGASLGMNMTATVAGTVNIDGIQVEEQTGQGNNPSPWKQPGVTRIDGGIIRTGVIQSTFASTIDSSQPMWAINMAGNMSINDAQVRGKIVVGSSGNSFNNSIAIASWNYGAGTANSWSIKGDGTFNIQGATGAVTLDSNGLTGGNGAFSLTSAGLSVTGYVNATSGYFSGNMYMNGGSINLNSNGQQNNVQITAGGLFAFGSSVGTATASITSSGSLTAKQGSIGGWSLSATSIFANTSYGYPMNLDASLGFIGAGSGSAWVAMQAGVGIWLGNSNSSLAPFSVDMNGTLKATSANITGTINAGSNIYGANFYTSQFSTPRISIGPQITYQSYPAIIFDYGGGTSLANGVISVGQGRMQLVSSASAGYNGYVDVNTFSGRIDLGFNGGSGVINLNSNSSVTGTLTTSSDITANQGSINIPNGFLYTSRVRHPSSGTLIFDNTSGEFRFNSPGTTGPYARLEAGAGGSILLGSSSGGTVYIGLTTASLQTLRAGAMFTNGTAVSSTADIKKNIQKHSYGLNKLKKINAVQFDREGDTTKLGLIAEEIAEHIPEAAAYHTAGTEGEEGALFGYDVTSMISFLVKTSQELAEQNELLTARLEQLEKKDKT